MVTDRKYVMALEKVKGSLKILKEKQSYSPKMVQVSEHSGLSEEHILEALEFGSQHIFSYIPYTNQADFKSAGLSK